MGGKVDGRTLRRRSMPANFAGMANALKQRELCKHFGAGPATIRRWVELAGVAKGRGERAMPDDFAVMAETLSVEALRHHYKCGSRALKRWLADAGIDTSAKRIMLPANIDEIAVGKNLTSLAAALGVHVSSLKRHLRSERPDLATRCADLGRKQTCNQQRSYRFSALPEVKLPAAANVTAADQARNYLQRFGPCFSARYSEKPALGGYFFCGRHFTTPQLIAEANRRGWNPNAWQQVAA